VDLTVIVRIGAGVVAAYLLGGVPWALIIGVWFFKVDVREHGSGNLGATNVMRVLGWKAALATFVLDIGKGALAVFVAEILVPTSIFGTLSGEWAMIAATLAVMAGHSFSPYIGFRGGKSVAAAGGALLVMVPLVFVALFVTWAIVFALTRVVAAGSVVIAIEFPILIAILHPGDWPLLGLAIVAAALVVVRHSANIGRIIKGEEPRISWSRQDASQQKGGS
jgi:acyl phosphate:glycerol-3-phosphate acyltransferase